MEAGAKRQAVIQAALELVGERGFHDSPMAEIAARADVAAGTIYRYFESKDTLIEEIEAMLERQILAAVNEGYPGGGSVRERFLHVQRRVIGHFLGAPLHFRFFEQYLNSPYGMERRRKRVLGRRRDLVGDLFGEALRQGVVKDLPLSVLYALVFGPATVLCRDHIQGLVALDERLIEKVAQACWDAIRPHPGRASGARGACA